MPALAITTESEVMEYWVVRVLIALAIEVSEEASRGTVIRVLPLPTGRLERDLEVLLEGSRTAAITVWFSRARYLDRRPLPIPVCREFC
jgi:hypothetical protein